MRQHPRIVAIVAALTLVLASSDASLPGRALARAGEVDWVGRRVLLKFGAVLIVDGQVVGDPAREPSVTLRRRAIFRVYRVERASGHWIWLTPEKDGFRGWTETAQVVLYDEAIDYFTREIRSHPRDPLAYLRRGRLYQEQGDEPCASADFDEAIRLDPENELAYYQRGLARQAQGDLAGALRDYDAALSLDPEDALAYNSRAHARQARGEVDGAIADYDAVIRLDPRNATVYDERGRLWHAKGELERALADFDASIRHDPGSAVAHLNRGLVLEALGNLAPALADYSEAIRLDPRCASAYSSRGHLEQRRREYSKALADFEEAIRLAPGEAGAYERRAWLWATCQAAEFRDGPRAIASATRACELTDWADPGPLETLAAACAEAGDFDTAVRWQTQAMALYRPGADRQEAGTRLALYQAKTPFHEGAAAP